MSFNEIKKDENGLVPAIIQDCDTKDVLMLGYMNEESFNKTVSDGVVWFYSRSRKTLWKKGETSGNILVVKGMKSDCDKDALLISAKPAGPVCHTGARNCFFNKIMGADENEPDGNILRSITNIIDDRVKNPKEGSYTNYLFEKGIDKMLKKVGEESAEVIIAAKNREKSEVTYEVSDLMYHLSVMLYEQGVDWNDIFKELLKRVK